MTNGTVGDEVQQSPLDQEARERIEQGVFDFKVLQPKSLRDKVEYTVDLCREVGRAGRGWMHKSMSIQAVPTPLGRRVLQHLNAIDGVEARTVSVNPHRSTTRVLILVDKSAGNLRRLKKDTERVHDLPEQVCLALERSLLAVRGLLRNSA